jgi:hypothetical protein
MSNTEGASSMIAEIKSEWMGTWVEILKILHSLDYNGFNEDLNAREYINLDKTQIMVVLADNNGMTHNIETKKAGTLRELSEDDQYDKIIVVAESQTKSAHNILRYNDKVETITSDVHVPIFSTEILSVINKKYDKICSEMSGNALVKAENIWKNAKFHARMEWKDQLITDFTQLIKLQSEPHNGFIDVSDNS